MNAFQSRIFLCYFLVFLAFISCKKSAEINAPNPYTSKVNSWLERQKNSAQNDVTRIELLQAHLNFGAIREEEGGRNEKLLIIPIDNEYKKKRRIDEQVDANLLVFINTSGNIRKAHIVLYTPETGQVQTHVPDNAFHNIMTTATNVPDGKYMFCNLSAVRNYQLKYHDGILREEGLVQKGNPKSGSVGAFAVKRPLTCYLVFLVTTYYDDHGYQTGVTEEFLFSYGDCGGAGQPGENQIPQPEDPGGGGGSVEYEYSYAKKYSKLWMVANLNDLGIYKVNTFTIEDDYFITGMGFGAIAKSNNDSTNAFLEEVSAFGQISISFTEAYTSCTARITYPFEPEPVTVTGSKNWTVSTIKN